ncbi:MAG TPA: histidine kinase N-terminal 7TM domain-containing protein, partial [Anaerolineae bacterium]|nr:histidine kinase N-terminal 7TM domain-containing protein [Anaerolineae bacterium]
MTSFSLVVLAVIVSALAVFVWRARPDSRINRWFATFTLSGAGWVLGVAGLHSGLFLDFWSRFTFASASLIPAAFLAFARVYPMESRWPSEIWGKCALFTGVLFSVLSLTTPFVVHDPLLTPTGLSRTSGPLYPVFALYFVVTWSIALLICFLKWRAARGQTRVQLQYLAFAMLLSGTGAIALNLMVPLLTGRSAHSWIGPYFGVLVVVLIAHAIIRHRLMDLRLVVHRSLTLTIAILVSLLPVALLLAALWPRLSAQLDADDLAALLAAVVGVSLLIPVTRDAAGRLLDRYVYRTHVNYQRTVRQASAELTRVLDLKILLPFLCRTLAGATSSEGAA